MERDNLRTSLIEHSIYGSTNALKDPWSSFRDHQDHDYLLGFSWPPRSYTCSFCKREFRSAQALGGHMNVHRRDRARLRLQSSSSSSSSSPPPPPPPTTFSTGSSFLNPNPNFSPSSLMGGPSSSPPLLTLIPPSSSLSASTGDGKALLANSLRPKFKDSSKNVHNPIKPSLVAAEEVKGLTRNDSRKFLKKGEIISLELEIGLIHDSKQDLDLELRLGLA